MLAASVLDVAAAVASLFPAGNLPVGMEHPVETALGTVGEVFSGGVVQPPVRQHRHDLSWRQRREFRLVAGQQDPLAFLLAEAVSHVPAAALATVDAIAITSKLTAPALQRGEPHTE